MLSEVKAIVPDMAFFDIDNYCDATTIQTAIVAIEKAEKLFVYIEAEPGPELGGVMKVMNRLLKMQVSTGVLYKGSHPKLDKMMVVLKNKVITAEDEPLVKVLKSFY